MDPAEAFSEWTGCPTPSRSCCHIPGFYICCPWERVQCFLGTAKHRVELIAYLHLKITSPLKCLMFTWRRGGLQSGQNAHCYIIRSPQYCKWWWWRFTVFLNATPGSNCLKNRVHSTFGHSKALRSVESPSKSTGLKCVLSIKHELPLLEISWAETLIILFFSEG